MTEPQARWPSFGYQPVPGLANRLIARYLRAQRKNMRRFFQERGLFAFADRMNQIRKSRQGMMAKNSMFQKVLNDYSALANPHRRSVCSWIRHTIGARRRHRRGNRGSVRCRARRRGRVASCQVIEIGAQPSGSA